MRLAGFVFICLLASVVFFLPKVSSQNNSKNELAETKRSEKAITIRAKERGFPRISFEDGKDLSDTNGANRNGSPSKLLTSADFDSDGTADLITADAARILKFYRGSVDSIYPNSAEAR